MCRVMCACVRALLRVFLGVWVYVCIIVVCVVFLDPVLDRCVGLSAPLLSVCLLFVFLCACHFEGVYYLCVYV